MYSHYVRTVAQAVGEREDAQLMLMFPYSVEDLYSFFYGMPEGDWRNDVTSMRTLAARKPRNKEKRKEKNAAIALAAAQLGHNAYNEHLHFPETNMLCANLIKKGNSFRDIAKKMCRIMCLYKKDLKEYKNNPEFCLHIFMCGLCVPTLLADQSIIGVYGSDEATYISVEDGTSGEHMLRVTKCLKFSDRAELLAVIGDCDVVQGKPKRNKVHGFAKRVNDCLNSIRQPEDLKKHPLGFTIFPAQTILRNFGFDWMRDELVPGYTDTDLASVEYANLKTYFDRLAENEL
jgi:hypothetical protein